MTGFDTVRGDYLRLVTEFPLRPIREPGEYDRAAALLDRLATRPDLSPGERHFFDALTRFVEDYDDRELPAGAPPAVGPADVLEHLMAESGLTQADVTALMGVGQSQVSMILVGTRAISKRGAAALAKRFRVSPNLFLYAGD